MSLLEVEGTFRDGKVELDHVPEGVGDARVRVTFLGEAPAEEPADDAAEKLLKQLQEGIDFGGRGYKNREELYDRVNRWIR